MSSRRSFIREGDRTSYSFHYYSSRIWAIERVRTTDECFSGRPAFPEGFDLSEASNSLWTLRLAISSSRAIHFQITVSVETNASISCLHVSSRIRSAACDENPLEAQYFLNERKIFVCQTMDCTMVGMVELWQERVCAFSLLRHPARWHNITSSQAGIATCGKVDANTRKFGTPLLSDASFFRPLSRN